MAVDGGDDKLKELVLWTLHFTTLLIEHSFSRHLYSSMEHLTTLLASSDLDVVLAVLNLLYMFSKRSNFIARLAQEKRSGNYLTSIFFFSLEFIIRTEVNFQKFEKWLSYINLTFFTVFED